MTTLRRRLAALAAAACLLPLAACNDGYGYDGPNGPPPPPPPPGYAGQGGYYGDQPPPPPPPPGYQGRDPYAGSYYGNRRLPPGAYDDGTRGAYRQAPPPPDRDDETYYAERYYRPDPNVRERTLTRDDRVYRGGDGRYYCRRSDGTTGAIVGAVAGRRPRQPDRRRPQTACSAPCSAGGGGALLGKSGGSGARLRCR